MKQRMHIKGDPGPVCLIDGSYEMGKLVATVALSRALSKLFLHKMSRQAK